MTHSLDNGDYVCSCSGERGQKTSNKCILQDLSLFARRSWLVIALALTITATLRASPTLEQTLRASDAEETDFFGTSVAVHGDWAVVGARGEDNSAPDAGAAYVFHRGADGVWSETQKIIAEDAQNLMRFGKGLAIFGEWLLVGGGGPSDGAPGGAVYVYQLQQDGQWTYCDKLTHSDTVLGDGFGASIAFDGSCAIIGAFSQSPSGAPADSGAAYVYEVDELGQWSLAQKLFPSSPSERHLFGWSVAMSNSVAVVGAPNDIGPIAPGAVYVFRKTDGEWIEEAKLLHPDDPEPTAFGISVSICGDLIVVGADKEELNDLILAGSVHVFREAAPGDWGYEATITAFPQPSAGDQFGNAVKTLPGGVIAIGAPVADCGASGSGAVFLYGQQMIGAWQHAHTICPPSPMNSDDVTRALAFSQSTLIAGNTGDNEVALAAGAALVYDVASVLCINDLNNDNSIDTADLGLLITAFGSTCDCCPEDINQDGAVDTADLSQLIGAFGSACP